MELALCIDYLEMRVWKSIFILAQLHSIWVSNGQQRINNLYDEGVVFENVIMWPITAGVRCMFLNT